MPLKKNQVKTQRPRKHCGADQGHQLLWSGSRTEPTLCVGSLPQPWVWGLVFNSSLHFPFSFPLLIGHCPPSSFLTLSVQSLLTLRKCFLASFLFTQPPLRFSVLDLSRWEGQLWGFSPLLPLHLLRQSGNIHNFSPIRYLEFRLKVKIAQGIRTLCLHSPLYPQHRCRHMCMQMQACMHTPTHTQIHIL